MYPGWWRGSNPGPRDWQSSALLLLALDYPVPNSAQLFDMYNNDLSPHDLRGTYFQNVGRLVDWIIL